MVYYPPLPNQLNLIIQIRLVVSHRIGKTYRVLLIIVDALNLVDAVITNVFNSPESNFPFGFLVFACIQESNGKDIVGSWTDSGSDYTECGKFY